MFLASALKVLKQAGLAPSATEALRLRTGVEILPAGTLPPDAKKIMDRRTWD